MRMKMKMKKMMMMMMSTLMSYGQRAVMFSLLANIDKEDLDEAREKERK